MLNSIAVFVFSLMFSIVSMAESSAELSVVELENDRWEVTVDMDEISNVYGFQAELLFEKNNINLVDRGFEHNEAWPEKGKVELRNYIKAEGAQYAVSLVRPAKAIVLEGSVLQFKIALLEAKPTRIELKVLKVSDNHGNVTSLNISNPVIVVGEPAAMMVYYIAGILIIFLLIMIALIMRKEKRKSESISTAA